MTITRTGIGLQVRLSGKEVVKKEIDDILAYAKKNEIINLKFDTKGMTQSLSDFSKALDGVSSKINNLNLSGVKIKPMDLSSGIKEELKTTTQTIDSFVGSLGVSVGSNLGKALKKNLKDGFKNSDIEKMIKDTINTVDAKDLQSSVPRDKEYAKTLLSQYQQVYDFVKGKKFSIRNIQLDKDELADINKQIKGVMKIDNKAISLDTLLKDVNEITKKWGMAFKGHTPQDNIKELSNYINTYKQIKATGATDYSAHLSPEEEAQNIANLTNKCIALYETLEKVQKQKKELNSTKITGEEKSKIDSTVQSLRQEEQAINKVKNAKKNISANPTTSTKDIQSYDALLARAEQIQRTMKGISQIKMSVKTDDEGVKKLNQAIIIYKNNLKQTVTETMKLYAIKDSEGKVIGSEFKSTGNLKISDNIEKQQKDEQKNSELYSQNEIKKTQALQNEIDKRTKLEQASVDKYNKILNDKARADEQAQVKALEDLEKRKASMQSKIGVVGGTSGLANNSLIDPNVITNIQTRLNSITTATPKAEIRKLENEIKNLSSTEPQIVKVQSKLISMADGLAKMKGKFGDSFGDSKSIAQVQAYEAEIEKLKKLLVSLQSGNKIDPAIMSRQMSQATSVTRNLNTALQDGAKSSTTFGEKLKNSLGSIGIYMSTYMVMQKVFNQIKEGISYVKYLDDSFTDMAITMNITKEGFNGMSSQIDDMAKKLGVTSQYVHDIARVYANANTSIEEIMQKVKGASQLANISGMSGEETTKAVQSISNQFDLMSKSGAKAGEVTSHIGDVLTAVSKNMVYDFADGIKQLNTAISTSGSVAEMSGVSLESYAATVGAIVQQTGKDGLNEGSCKIYSDIRRTS